MLRTVTILPTGGGKVWLLGILFCFFGSITNETQAQCAVQYDGFQPGEKVTYELSFNWKFVWTKAGEASLTFSNTTYDSKPAYRMDLIAAGNKRADFFFKLRDTLTSVISTRLEPMYFRKGAIEGKKYWVDEAFFTYSDGVSHVKQVRTKNGEKTEYNHEDSRCIHDLLSVLAWARAMNPDDYNPGDRISIPVATGRRVEEQNLIYVGKGPYTAGNGTTYNCLFFSLVGDRKNKEKQVMAFHVTDDKNRLPVHIDLFLNFGAARATLSSTTGNKYPFDSIVTK